MERCDRSNLINFLSKGDNKAYKWLYSNYYVALKSLAFYYVKDWDVSGDMVQETFFSLFKSSKHFSSVDDVKFFLYASLKNKCISQLRKEAVRNNSKGLLKEHYLQLDEFWDKVMEEDVYSRLMSAIHTLPPQCKLVMLMVLEGNNTRDIAQKLGISTETVKDHKANGKRKLAEWLKNKDMLLLIHFLLI